MVKSDFNSHDSIKEMYAYLNNEDVKLDVLVNNAGWTKYIKDKDINSLKKELFNLKIMKKSGQLTDTSQFKKVKKQIASLLTKERLNKNA